MKQAKEERRYRTLHIKEETYRGLVEIKRGMDSLDDVVRKLLEEHQDAIRDEIPSG